MKPLDSEFLAPPFGHFAPHPSKIWLRWVTGLGVSRGAIAKWVGAQWRKNGNALVDTTVRGIHYRLYISGNTTDAKLLASSKIYDGREINALAKPLGNTPSEQAVFVDIGANSGYYSLSLAQRGYGRVIAIEPNPTTLSLLRCNINLNAFGQRITVVPLCIGDGQPTPFYYSGGLGDASVFAESHTSKPFLVNSAPLIEILNTNGVAHIDGMKIDIEGYEDRALVPFFSSAPRTLYPKVIVIEICNQTLWKTDMIALLKKTAIR